MNYKLPIATKDKLGGVKVGADFSISNDGTLSIKNMEKMKQQVSELPEMVAAGKQLIADAITQKGVPTDSGATFGQMADNVLSINGSSPCGVADFTEKMMGVVGISGVAIFEEA